MGKTTLLEAIATSSGIQPRGGRSYAETEDKCEGTAIFDAVEVTIGGRRPPKGLFLRADRFAEVIARAGRLPCQPRASGAWQISKAMGGVLSLLTARIDASEEMLFIFEKPETGLLPQRHMALLTLLDDHAPRRPVARVGGG